MKTNIILMILLLVITGCAPTVKTSVESIREKNSPCATSSFSSDEITASIIEWVKLDKQNRAISSAKTTGSMLPTIDSRTIIVLEKINNATVIVEGDIVGTKNKVLHRVHSMQNNFYTLKGDSNNFLDDPVHRDDLEWRVVIILYTNHRTILRRHQQQFIKHL